MFCAFSFPWLDSKLEQIESLPSGKANFAKLTILGVATLLGLWWYYSYFSLSKREYNKVHPYTSFVPIFLYLVFRNLTEALRKRHLHLFAWCGKITLETYILQFHVWMKTTGINGSPKFLMVWFPDIWTNFVVISAVYIFLSFRVFHITAALRGWVIPKEGGAALVPCLDARGWHGHGVRRRVRALGAQPPPSDGMAPGGWTWCRMAVFIYSSPQ